MEKTIVNVPKGIRYIGDWKEFEKIFPRFPHILDKQLTGCGMTEWFIKNSMNVVLCSPRNILLDNKEEQHPGEVYRVRSDYFDKELGVDKDTSKPAPVEKSEPEEEEEERTKDRDEQETKSIFERINTEMEEYFIQRNIRPKKILVTYDSFHVVKDVLQSRGILKSFVVVIDEFQSIFTDSRFKSSTEMEFVSQLQGLQCICYLSATPMMDKYLKDIPEFAELPYYELDWSTEEPSRIIKPNLLVRMVRSIYDPAKKIIDSYRENNFKKVYVKGENGNPVIKESKEAVFYLNSVANIIGIIKRNNLMPQEVNILCARTDRNERLIKAKLGNGWSIGKVPLENEPRKMFTFCTRTVYLGADFYSDNARSFILSDANVECLAVDISLDLPQILGRQRLFSNPWKNSAEFYYRPLTDDPKKVLTQEEFDKIIQSKIQYSMKKIENYDAAPNKDVAINDIISLIKFLNYQNDYVGVNTRNGSHINPELNKLVMIAERRAFDIQQIDYKDRFSVISAVGVDTEGINGEIQAFYVLYDDAKTVYEKLRLVCEANLSAEARAFIEENLEDRIKSLMIIGKDRVRALGYNQTKINKELNRVVFSKRDLESNIYSEFHEGDIIERSEVKQKLKIIYDNLDYKKTAKATDLEGWFEVEPIQLRSGGIKYHALKLIKKLN